jgi:hypothetical protein
LSFTLNAKIAGTKTFYEHFVVFFLQHTCRIRMVMQQRSPTQYCTRNQNSNVCTIFLYGNLPVLNRETPEIGLFYILYMQYTYTYRRLHLTQIGGIKFVQNRVLLLNYPASSPAVSDAYFKFPLVIKITKFSFWLISSSFKECADKTSYTTRK